MAVSYRIKFSRKGPASYMGHLDVLRYFQKAISRSGLDIKYSEGFNPHQIISFAYPLGVSMETEGDYFDIDLNAEEATNIIKDRLNSTLHDGIYVLEVYKLPENAINAMASVALADYDVLLDGNGDLKNDIESLLSSNELLIEKKGKKGITLTDIRPGILNMNCGSINIVSMSLTSGSSLNIKPSTVIDCINNQCGREYKIIKIIRKELYRLVDDNTYIPLGKFE